MPNIQHWHVNIGISEANYYLDDGQLYFKKISNAWTYLKIITLKPTFGWSQMKWSITSSSARRWAGQSGPQGLWIGHEVQGDPWLDWILCGSVQESKNAAWVGWSCSVPLVASSNIRNLETTIDCGFTRRVSIDISPMHLHEWTRFSRTGNQH